MVIKEHAFEDIATPTGPMRVHLFQPQAPGRYPGIVLYSEIYQITGPVRRMAAFLAGQGYVVSAPEVYHEYESPGTVLLYDAPGTDRGNTLKFEKTVAAYDSDARAALDHLKAHPACPVQNIPMDFKLASFIGLFTPSLYGYLSFNQCFISETHDVCVHPSRQ